LTLVSLLPVYASDHWGCAEDEKLVNDEFGDPQCRKETVTVRCPGGDASKYFDKEKGRQRCCLPPNKLHIFNDNTKSGICCPAGQYYATNSQGGKCCPIDHILKMGNCEMPPRPDIPDVQHIVSKPSKCTPPVCAGPCALSPVCGNERTNGLNYGSCYVMTFPDGKQLGRRRDDWNYEKDGYIQDIPFKVCKTPTDCSKFDAVPPDGSFYLEDQLGGIRDPKGTKGWINNAHNGNHLSMTGQSTQAGQFQGRASCANGQCAIQLFGGPEGGGLTYACPVQNPGITFWPNRKVGIKIQFAEVPCEGDWPAFRTKKWSEEL